MKKNKKINALVAVSLLLSLIINVQNVWAESYTVTPVGVPGGNPNNPSTNPIVGNNGSWGVLPGEYFKVSSGGNAYCADPGSGTPSGNMTVVDMGGEKHQKAFDYICNQMDKLNNDAQRVAYLKAYSVYSGFATCRDNNGKNTCDGYNALMDGYAKWNPSFGNFDIVGAVKDAASAQNSPVASKPQFTVKGNSIVLNTTVKGTLKATNPGGYDIKVNGQSFAEKEYSAGTYTITIDTSNCNSSQEVSFVFEYEESLVSQGYTAKRLQSSTQGNQSLIYCAPSSSSCQNGVCEAEGKLTPTCNPNTCDPNPEISTPGFDPYGNALCNGDGTTVVVVEESPIGLGAERNEIACISDAEHDATDTILGADNDYCNIYCTEKVELILSGPDFRHGDEEVFVNAGTYFEINGELKEHDEITCYGELNFDKFEEDVKIRRADVVSTYNEWQKEQAIADNKLNKYQQTITNTDAEGNQHTENIGCDVSVSYQGLKMGSDGKITKELKTADVPYSGKNCSEAVNLPNRAAAAKSEYESARATANEDIPRFEQQWKDCTNWNFANLEGKVENKANKCYTTIEFDYADGTADVKVESIAFDDISSSTIPSGKGTTKLNVGVCDSNGSNCNKDNSGYDVSNDFINRSAKIDIVYKFDNGFAINYETNEIIKENAAGNCISEGKCSDIIHGFPIDIDTPQGAYGYEYIYYGLGHIWEEMNYSGSCSMGRFDGDIADYDNYMCYYNVNNCKDCDVYCDGNGCEINIPDCHGNGCKVACVGGGCILDINSGFLATFRTISLNADDFAKVAILSASPNTLLAYNSSKNFGKSNWDNQKGADTSSEISGKGENIYSDEPEYSINLTPVIISDIKRYNRANESNGGYLNDTLTCNDISGKDYGLCVSDFIHVNFETAFEIRKPVDATSGQIDNKEIHYKTYGSTGEFQGPAWK